MSLNKLNVLEFKSSIDGYKLPTRFNYPFYYEPHPLCLLAANELQEYLNKQKDWQHNFGLEPSDNSMVIGKMFGVLLVSDSNENIGYLAAFSGKLANSNHHNRFVPPVYDTLSNDGFFKKETIIPNQLNKKIFEIENNIEYIRLKQKLLDDTELITTDLAREKQRLKQAKKNRKKERELGKNNLSQQKYKLLEAKLSDESVKNSFYYRELIVYYESKIEKTKSLLSPYENRLKELKRERKEISLKLQNKIFDSYNFLNAHGETKSLLDIFITENQIKPPAGAGECAAPKLLQYAYKNNLKPLSMAEFWWGKAPDAEIRKHKHYYPACKGKCQPILGHMLKGLDVEDNPLLKNIGSDKNISTVYEDEYLLVINKPVDLLSVPGKNILDSVYSRMKQKFPKATGPLIVHRLDMSTSGLMLIAKSSDVYKALQKQFINRTIKKRYRAILNGNLIQDKGIIELPLRVDLDDRPRQLVCYEHGKPAITKWEVVSRQNNKTMVLFYPITGRTHQLRVHAAHHLGLNMPIVGDDLYGTKDDRLYLHAERLEFIHPKIGELIVVEKSIFSKNNL